MDDGAVKQENNRFLSPRHIIEQSGIGAGMQVADFGCGQGDFSLAAAKLVGPEGKVYAIDIQDSALSSVRSKARIEGELNIDLVKGNVEVPGASGRADASCDAVILTNLLFQTEKRAEILREASRVLKPGGIAVFVDWKKEAPLGPMRTLRMEKEAAEQLIAHEGFAFERGIEAGAFHFGMIFIKRES
ncbi:class I SAM-dependent methyltransferase [Candidatus Azambacteria bacterium]|nr:class I SAM-dependent methyltransferase [Candidatus Azambacteria bacterium]